MILIVVCLFMRWERRIAKGSVIIIERVAPNIPNFQFTKKKSTTESVEN